jgi:hypothetical protein
MNLRLTLAATFVALAVAPSVFADIDHSKLNGVLSKYVSGGRVDYEGLRGNTGDLDDYLKSVSSASGELKMAFYINAYNAIVLKALVSETALPKQVTDLKGFFDTKKYKVAGKDMTLNEIETKIRKEYKDPRIHFACNCGAESCPPLPATAFSEKTLDATLTKLTQNFLNGSGIKIDDTKKEIKLTKLMDWYGDDFIGDSGLAKDKAAIEFSKKYLNDEKKKALEAAVTAGYKVTYQGYNWTPNAKKTVAVPVTPAPAK